MEKKNRMQVVILVAAVFLCGIAYVILGPGNTGAGAGTDMYVTGGATAKESRAATESAAKTAGEVYVYVCGAVKKPGVYSFSHNPRVVEAVEEAGGFTKKADTLSVNLASVLEDGAQVVIGEKGKSADAAGVSGASGITTGTDGGTDDNKIDINTAGAEELTKIPGIGEAKSTAIVTYRNEHGRFQKAEDLMNIPGIKQGIFDRIKDYIKVG
ncbi:MAG: helix-hairpin-helix domain-containing protein [Eubacterium sp.]|nr:helix-hairpin-helix domain-containing protein [Eubacterium sp.]